MAPQKQLILIHKFGGAALADATAIRRAAAIVAAHRERPSVVVTSALAGVTDALLAAAMHAVARNATCIEDDVGILRRRHYAVLEELHVAQRSDWPGAAFDMLASVLGDVRKSGELTPALTDEILAHGERISASIFAAVLAANGIKSEVIDAAVIIQTDGRFGNAAPDLQRTAHAARDHLVALLEAGVVTVIPGFIGASPDGATVTLGRGGSDLSATVLAQGLDARDVYLWKDVPGILTADPRAVPTARVVTHISAREAAELAYYGAKVLHPRALVPLTANTRLFVRPFASPDSPGTQISLRAPSSGSPVRALSAIRNQALVTVTGNGMIDVPGIAARTFGALGQAAISVSLITQASSEHSITFAVRDSEADAARACLLAAFANELQRREIDNVDVKRNLATIAVVGVGMAHTPGIAGRIFSALAEHAINVVAIAQGSSEINVSFVIDEERASDAQRAVHAAFQLDKLAGGRIKRTERADVIILGFGRIGRELASHATHSDVRQRIRIVGIVDRSGFLFDERGINDRRLAAASLAKRRGASLASLQGARAATTRAALTHISNHALTRPILVDVTGHDTHADLIAALQNGMDVVLANKVPMTIDHTINKTLLDTARQCGRRVLFEATVGAGLPIIDTFEKLVASGDRVLSIEGCPSGTLGYVLGELGRGTPFSVAVTNAMAAGYTEPDPRDDLSGRDVARKGLILGRLLGFAGELDDVATESLVPEILRHLSAAHFIERLQAGELDAAWSDRVERASAKGEVLRYRATATKRSVRVGLVSVPTNSPLGTLTGTDNQFVFTTQRYRDNPLIIIGPGAGPAVTAQGVLNDILKLATSRMVSERPAKSFSHIAVTA